MMPDQHPIPPAPGDRPAPPPKYAAPPAPTPCADSAAEAHAEFTSRATAQLAILTQYAMNLARLAHDTADRLAPGMLAANTPAHAADRLPPLMRAFDRMSRTIRQTMALEARLHAGLNLKPATNSTPATSRRHLVRKVEDAIDTHARPECRENLLRDLYERLDDPDLADDLDQDLAIRPIKDIIAEFRADLGIGSDVTTPARRRSPADLRTLHHRAHPHPAQSTPANPNTPPAPLPHAQAHPTPPSDARPAAARAPP